MELIVISAPDYFKGEASLINQLFEAGLSVFHVRKPGSDRLAYASLISGIAACYHDRIALHEFHELMIDYPSIKRFHYPERLRKQTFKDETDTLVLAGKNWIWSTSVHCLKDLTTLTGFDYAFYGPVFDSISKPGYVGVAGDGLLLPERTNGTKIFALGGIDARKAVLVKRMGFDGLAVLGAIWNKKDEAVERFKQLINSTNAAELNDLMR